MPLRTDLEFSSQQHLGKNVVVVKDPLTARYFRFTENQGILLRLLTDSDDVEVLASRATAELGGTVSTTTIAAFMKSLEDKLLLDTERVREKLDNVKSQKRLDRGGILYRKLVAFNPERVFDWLEPRTRWMFTPLFHVAALLIISSGFLINFLHWRQLTVDVWELLNLHGILLIYIVTLSVVTMHEFAHGMTCVHFGGKVQEVGFMLIYFQPAFYCDVSDSWMFPTKKQRMWVTFAGGYFQLVVWGIWTILWRLTDPDTAINQLAMIVIVFAGLQTLFNFNPLIKLDGYYMLSDYLEIPNLRSKSVSMLWKRLTGTLEKRPVWREERALLLYGVATIVFSTTLLMYVYIALFDWATSEFAFAGLVGFVMFSTYTLRRTAMESLAGVRSVLSRASYRKYRNAGIVCTGLVVAFVGKWELKIPAEFRVIARDERTVRAETEGVIVDIRVREGTMVAKGDVLALLRDFPKQQRISELEGDLEKKRTELALLKAGARSEEIDRLKKYVETKRVELLNARRNDEERNQLKQTVERKMAQLRLDQQTLARNRELAHDGLIAKAELERSETQVELSERDVQTTESSLRVLSEVSDRNADLKARELEEAESQLRAMLAGNRPEQIRQVEAEVHKLSEQVRILNEELEKTELRSPIDGVVSTPFVERKRFQSLEAGDEFCRIVDIGKVTIEMQVPEKEMADIRPGNPVSMIPRSFPSLNLQGRIDFIAPVAQTIDSQQMVVVRSELPNDEMVLKPDMTGVARIYCGERRIASLMSRRLVRWIRTEFWHLLP